MKKKDFSLKNKGFSLVELLVAMAIVSVVGSVIIGVMTFSTKSFGRSSAETNLQEDAQVILAQMGNYIIDTDVALRYYVDVDPDGSGTSILKDDQYPGGALDFQKKWLEIFKNDGSDMTVETLIWKKSSGEINYRREKVDAHGSRTTDIADTLLADQVDGFAVDLTKVADNREVGLELTLEKGDAKYDSSKTVNMRNTLQITGDPTPVIDNPVVSTVTGVKVYPKETEMSTNSQKSFQAVVHGTNNPSQQVTWTIEGNTSSSTQIHADGRLWIAPDESADTIIVRATSVQDPGKSGTATVTVKHESLYNFEVTPLSVGMRPGQMQDFHALVTKKTNNEVVDRAEITWRIVSGDTTAGAFQTNTGADNVFTAALKAKVPQTLKVTVTAKVDGNQIGAKDIEITIDGKRDLSKYPLIEGQFLNIQGSGFNFYGSKLFASDNRCNIHVSMVEGNPGGGILLDNGEKQIHLVSQNMTVNGKTEWVSCAKQLEDYCFQDDIVKTTDLRSGLAKILNNPSLLGEGYQIYQVNDEGWEYNFYQGRDELNQYKTIIYKPKGRLTIQLAGRSLANCIIVAQDSIEIQGNEFKMAEVPEGMNAPIIYSMEGNVVMSCGGTTKSEAILYAPKGNVDIRGNGLNLHGFIFAGLGEKAADDKTAGRVTIANGANIYQSDAAIRTFDMLLDLCD